MPSAQGQPVQADAGLERAQKRIDDQVLVVKKLKMDGIDSHSAERLLGIYRELLAALTLKH